MNAVAHFFKAIDSFLNACVVYLDERIITGKFVMDIAYIIENFRQIIIKKSRKGYYAVSRSKPFFYLIKYFFILWRILMKIPLFATIMSMLADTLRILVFFYSELFIIFAITFTSSILLLNIFQSSALLFVTLLIPVILLDIFCTASLYYCIERRELGEHISIWHSFTVIFKRFNLYSFPVLSQLAILLETVVVYSIILLFFSYIFDLFHVYWGGSFLYWFIVIFIGSLLLIGIFYLSIIMHQTFFAVLLDGMPFEKALKRGRTHVWTFMPYYLFFYILFYLFCALFTWKAILSYLYLGLTIGSFWTIALGAFIGFLLRHKFPLPIMPEEIDDNIGIKTYLFFSILIFFGFINYLLVATLLVKEYQPILSFVQTQQNNFLANQELKQYSNTDYGYTINYPQNWNVYQWNKNSVTFYNNYTGTITGGTWMTVSVSDYNRSAFDKFYNANPGVVPAYSTGKTLMTKISNVVIQGLPAVNYTLIKSGTPYTQYETHFLIHKDSNIYDIAFLSVTNDVSGYNNDLYEKIVNSFRFVK